MAVLGTESGRLDHRVALITGAGSGIGRAMAEEFAARGASIAACDLVAGTSEETVELALRAGAPSAVALTADVSVADEVARAVDEAIAALGRVDILCSNAGVLDDYRDALACTEEQWDRVFGVNLKATWLLSRAVLPGMLARGEGAIVNVASILSFASSLPPDPLPLRPTYAATKGFVLTFSRTLAAELAGTRVRVQVVCPGYTTTEFHMTTGADPVEGTAPDDQPEGAMLPEDVVQASLVALDTGEIVCVPGLADPTAVDGLIEAEARMRGGNFAPLADRYR